MDETYAGRTYSDLPTAEFGFPGPVRDLLVGAILDGRKVSTTGLVIEYENDQEPLPQPGKLSVVIDSSHHPVAVIETTSMLVVPLRRVDLAHALDEGEGYTTVAEWRAAHETFWHGDEMRTALGDPSFSVTDTTLVVLERFRLVTSLP